MDEKDLQILALEERIGQMAREAAREVAGLRVQITQMSQQLQQGQPDAEVLEGEVVDG